ncbi:hypothetical protein ACQCVK_14975 [Rossellomorea vietnamensis]|uniref:hypothetical protein n=1 Tax=Rossellomorea vietnamensis TaxID=218284 RepID=UPI003CF09FCF
MRMTLEDLLKFGKLFSHNGVMDGRRLISESWIEESLKSRFLTYEHIGYYGYHWWTSKIDEKKLISTIKTSITLLWDMVDNISSSYHPWTLFVL